MSRLHALLLALAVLPACSLNKLVADNMEGSFRDSTVAFNREGSPRHAREAAPGLLKMLDGFIVSSPENEGLLLRGAEMNATFAFGFIEEEDPAWARELYRKALSYGRRALALERPDLVEALGKDEATLRAALAKIEPGDDDTIVPLFWTAFAWGGLVNVSRADQRTMSDLPKVVAAMERLSVLAPGFFNAGPHLFLAVYYSSRGSMLGGDVKKSRKHFEEVFKRTKGKYLIADVLFARFYCVALGEKEPEAARAEFVRRLTAVLATPDEIDPENRLITALAKQRAKKLIGELDDLILPPLPPEESTQK
jgi:hypothetical protein